MKNTKWTVPLLAGSGVLLFLLMSAALLGVSFAGVRVVPAAGDRSATPADPVLGADSAAYWLRVELEPPELYELAVSQTVRISTEKRSDDGEVTSMDVGAGIIASSDGYILTNSHVVIGAKNAGETVKVELHDGRTYEGAILGADPETEVALLKIEAEGLSAAQFGSSGELLPCQTVYAMGHPSRELPYTMTCGIVSGLDRTIGFSDGTKLHMFQFDAPINSGNSGGPVYDVMGSVVGIVTAKYFALDAEGISLALPIDDVLPIAKELKEHGYVTGRPLLGVVIQNVAPNAIAQGSPPGSKIYSLEEGLAGARAGLQPDDIIVAIEDRPVTGNGSITEIRREFRAGDTVTVRFWRAGELLETELTFDEVTPEHPIGPVDIEEEETPEPSGEEIKYDGPPDSETETEPVQENGSEPGPETERGT